MPYETRCKTSRTSAKFRATKWRRIFSQLMHPIHPIGPKTDVFLAFPTIWVHSGSFACLTKLGAKRAELVQKFVPRSRVGFFRNGGTRSTPCDPKLTFGAFVQFGCIRDCLVALRNSMQNGPNKCKSSCHEVASDFFATEAPDPPHVTLN